MTDQELLVETATKLIGVHKPNPKIFQFLLSVIEHPIGNEPWCAAFVFYCLSKIARKTDLFKSPSVAELWYGSSKDLRITTPEVGSISIWSFADRTGHCGIVTDINVNQGIFHTIEGNTSSLPKPFVGINEPIVRDGGFVAAKTRHLHPPPGPMNLVGFLRPWRISLVPDASS